MAQGEARRVGPRLAWGRRLRPGLLLFVHPELKPGEHDVDDRQGDQDLLEPGHRFRVAVARFHQGRERGRRPIECIAHGGRSLNLGVFSLGGRSG